MAQIIAMAAREGYDGIELRFVQGEDSLWKLPVFSGKELGIHQTRTSGSRFEHFVPGYKLPISFARCRRTRTLDHTKENGWRIWLPNWVRRACECSATRSSLEQTAPPRKDGLRTPFGNWRRSRRRRGVEVWIENHGDFAGSASDRGNSRSKQPVRTPEWFGIRRTASPPCRSSPQKALRLWELRFAMFTSRICAETETDGNMSCLERAISPCLN